MVTIRQHNSCLNLYEKCIQDEIKHKGEINTSSKKLYCAKICKEEPSPIEYLYKTGVKIEGVFPKEYKEYGIFLIDNYNFCYNILYILSPVYSYS